MCSAGVYDIHFIVTPDTEHEGKVLISVNLLIPRLGSQLRYSRMLSVAEGQVANFAFEPMGPYPSPAPS
jgi:hypothetical protein